MYRRFNIPASVHDLMPSSSWSYLQLQCNCCFENLMVICHWFIVQKSFSVPVQAKKDMPLQLYHLLVLSLLSRKVLTFDILRWQSVTNERTLLMTYSYDLQIWKKRNEWMVHYGWYETPGPRRTVIHRSSGYLCKYGDVWAYSWSKRVQIWKNDTWSILFLYIIYEVTGSLHYASLLSAWCIMMDVRIEFIFHKNPLKQCILLFRVSWCRLCHT